jgi:hypothetical protein
MVVLLLVIISAEIFDISLNKVYVFINSSQFSIVWNITAFVSIALAYIIGQHFIMEYVKKSSKDLKTKGRLSFSIIHKIVKTTQYPLVGLLVTVAIQMILFSMYNSRLLIFSIWISYIPAICMLGLLAQRFFHWYTANRNAAVLTYGLSATLIGIAAAISLGLSTLLSIGAPVDIGQIVGLTEASMPYNIVPLNNAYLISSVLAFILTWIATVLVLRHHSRTLGLIKYWILVSIPLVYFLTQFQPLLLPLFSSYSAAEPFTFATVYTIVFSASKPVGGILFAVAFWSVAKTLSNKQLRNYMIIAGYGLALIFSSEQAILLVNRIYPPFGLATTSFLGLASYLVLVGIYSSAISVSEDSKLRQSIRSLALRETKFLDSIGMAQMEQQIQKRVIEIAKRNQGNMAEETGIQSSVTEEDMKAYLEQVINEIKKYRPSK